MGGGIIPLLHKLESISERLLTLAKRSKAHQKAQREGKIRDNYECQLCGSQDHIEGHHIVDVAFGGAADSDNIISLCHEHHKAVHRGDIDLYVF